MVEFVHYCSYPKLTGFGFTIPKKINLNMRLGTFWCISATSTNTPCVKKTRHQTLFSISSPNIDRFSKFFHCYTRQEICNKAAITDPTKPQRRRYTTLWNISFRKLQRPKAHRQLTSRARTVHQCKQLDIGGATGYAGYAEAYPHVK